MKHAGGRPKKVLNYELIDKLAHIQCTQEEIAHIIGVSIDTLQRDEKFCGVYKKGIEEGKSSLRRLQWKAANDGNVTMMIWLGKQYLKQSDKQEVTGADGTPFKVTVSTAKGKQLADKVLKGETT